ncbi:hypothetical protein MTR67_009878, partial [Solanum verrucosum]
MHALPASFDFKAEALSSIYDIFLLEIVTKAHGRPNRYRKVLKSLFMMHLQPTSSKETNALQKISAWSFHSSHPITVINLPPQVVVTVHSLMKGNVIKFLGRVRIVMPDIFYSNFHYLHHKKLSFLDSGIKWRDYLSRDY